jgi:serine/threonine-protein kinase
MPLRPGTLLQDRYEIRGALEDHAGASLWAAVDLKLGREVVVCGFPLPPSKEAQGRAELKRRTAALTAQIHPRLQTLLDFVMAEGQAFAITKPSLGRSLADHLWQGPLPWPEARRILDGVLALLEVAHTRGMPHLRTSPSTIVLDPWIRTAPCACGTSPRALRISWQRRTPTGPRRWIGEHSALLRTFTPAAPWCPIC